MARTRISTTVDTDLLNQVRAAQSGVNDAKLIDAALAALLSQQERTRIDAAYQAAYSEHPIAEADEWGDLATFREAAASS